MHVAVPGVDSASEHVPVKEPEPEGVTEKFTVPVGVASVPVEVSLTVAVQVVAWPTERVEGEQLMPVLVVR